MFEDATEELVAGAEAYEELHVPALFGEWVELVLDAADVGPGQGVLDVACGTGVLARGALARVGDRGSVAGVDPDPGMLTVAERVEPGVVWKAGTAEAIPFPGDAFDAVVSQFGMMFFVDRPAAVAEMLRVARPGGRVAVAVWDSLENTPAYAREVALLEEMAGTAAADALRAPFSLGDPARLVGLFEEGGARDVAVISRTGRGRFPSVRTQVEADLRGWLPVMGVQLPEALIGRILDEAEVALGDFVTAQGRVEFDAPAHIVTARKPG